MQHGTGRELATDLVENVRAVLAHERSAGRPYGDLVAALDRTLAVLTDTEDLDAPGVYGPDYGFDGDNRPRSQSLGPSGISATTYGRTR